MIIDCFPFFNELDLLEIRLNELSGIVDAFVLTESPKTFSGLKKPMFFKENARRFKDFNIIQAPFDDDLGGRFIEREGRQKQHNLDYAYNISKPGDIIIQGDVDEIPKASVIKGLLDKDWGSVRLVMKLFYYYMNYMEVSHKKKVYKNSRLLRPTERIIYDEGQRDKTDLIVYDAGWHFSYLGDIKEKLKAWGHADVYNKPPYNTDEHIEKCKKEGLDIAMREGKRKLVFKQLTDLDYLPEYVLNNMDKFKKYIV